MSIAIALPGTEPLSFGSSKLFQIIVPLATYMVLQETPWFRGLFPRLTRTLNPRVNVERWEYILKMLVGFISWKVGCDLGFLIVNTGAAPWSIAFTVAGLIPYGIAMYVVYYLIGQKMIIQGQLNPFKEQYVPPRSSGRPALLKQTASKFLHESMNSTSANVPLRQVCIKPAIDYGAIIVSWPLYNVALLYSQTGEINFAPFSQFTFLSIFVFYVVNVLGFILGFNLGEFLYFRLHYLIESFKAAGQRIYIAQQIKVLWNVFDENGDGSISSREFRKAVRILGLDLTNAELDAIVREIDLDRSGSIEFDEFKARFSSRRGARGVRLLLDTTEVPGGLGVLNRLTAGIAVQLQSIKNNTNYIRFQGFLRRYGLNNRWLLSGGLGVASIIVLEPSISRAIFSWSDRLNHQLFYAFGHLDLVHLAQVAPTETAAQLPDPRGLTAALPEQLASLDAIADRESNYGPLYAASSH